MGSVEVYQGAGVEISRSHGERVELKVYKGSQTSTKTSRPIVAGGKAIVLKFERRQKNESGIESKDIRSSYNDMLRTKIDTKDYCVQVVDTANRLFQKGWSPEERDARAIEVATVIDRPIVKAHQAARSTDKQSDVEWTRRIGRNDQVNHEALPQIAPELWEDRPSRQSEDPIQFLNRVYAPWVADNGLRAHLRSIDRPLYYAIAKNIGRHGVPRELAHLFVDRSKSNDEELKRLEIKEPRDVLERVSDPKEADRLYGAARRRQR